LITTRNGAIPLRCGAAPAYSPPAQRARYATTPWLFQGGFGHLACGSPPTEPSDAEENIVAAAFARYIGECESADRRMSGGVAMPSRITGELPPRRAAAPGYADCPKPEAERVC
jgi:hypothetical protein